MCYGQNVMSFAARYGNFCLNAIDVVEGSRGTGKLSPGARAIVEDSIRFMQSRCDAVQDRFAELGERNRGQINMVSAWQL